MRSKPTIIAIIWAATAPIVAAAAGPPARDVWYAFLDDQTRYGSLNVRVRALPDDRLEYLSDTRVLIDFLGAQRQEITEHARIVVDSRLLPVSFDIETGQMTGTVHTSGRRENDTLTVSTTRGGVQREFEIDLSGQPPVVIEYCLADWLSRQPATVRATRLRLLSRETWQIDELRATRHEDHESDTDRSSSDRRTEQDAADREASDTDSVDRTTWKLIADDDSEATTFVIDEAGVLYESITRIPQSHLRRCTPAEAADIEHRRLDGRYVLTFPFDKDIRDPSRLTELTVRLTWRDIDLERFELQDARQRTLEAKREADQYVARIRVEAPESPTESNSLPVTGEEFAPYLAETEFIKPDDPAIRAAARKVVTDQMNALQATRALSKWVFEYIDGALVAETLSGPEVLACKTGKCTEYSTLFASLARSVGIPTRVTLGERAGAGQWLGHMWNEVYVGRWIPVDASANEVGGSFALLKFIHSDTVAGTQPLRWALTESLEISIEDFELRPSPLEGKYTTGIEGRVYTNVDHACRLTAPGPGWTIEDKSRPGLMLIRFRPPDADDVQIHLVSFSLPPGTKPKSLIDTRIGIFKPSYDPFEVLRNEPRPVHGLPGHTSHFGGVPTRGETKKRSLVTEIVWTSGPNGYLLNLIATAEDHDRFLADYQRLVDSFEVLSE